MRKLAKEVRRTIRGRTQANRETLAYATSSSSMGTRRNSLTRKCLSRTLKAVQEKYFKIN